MPLQSPPLLQPHVNTHLNAMSPPILLLIFLPPQLPLFRMLLPLLLLLPMLLPSPPLLPPHVNTHLTAMRPPILLLLLLPPPLLLLLMRPLPLHLTHHKCSGESSQI
uniref:Proline- and leucine-rich protein n=1 Tax=Pisum sativum TaxID=3888 RepID=Q41051_PEA|nr:proline- and leucine-rich protein [Pisum sativum]